MAANIEDKCNIEKGHCAMRINAEVKHLNSLNLSDKERCILFYGFSSYYRKNVLIRFINTHSKLKLSGIKFLPGFPRPTAMAICDSSDDAKITQQSMSGLEFDDDMDSNKKSVKRLMTCVSTSIFARVSKSTISKRNQNVSTVKDMEALEEYSRGRVIVRNIPFRCSTDDIKEALQLCGPISYVDILTKIDSAGNVRRVGCAFVQFIHPTDAKRAVYFIKVVKIKGRLVSIDMAVPKQLYCSAVGMTETTTSKAQNSIKVSEIQTNASCEIDEKSLEKLENQATDTKYDIKHAIFIQNLSSNITEESLREWIKHKFAFSAKSCVLVRDRETNLPKGSAFVYFSSPAEVATCLNKSRINHTDRIHSYGAAEPEDDLMFEDRIITILPALSREDALKTRQERDMEKTLRRVEEKQSWGHKIHAQAVSRLSSKEQQFALTDNRNLHLMKMGVLFPRDPGFAELSESERRRHLNAWREKCTKLRKDRNFFVSSTRVCVRNLPVSVTSLSLSLAFTRILRSKHKLKRCVVMREKKPSPSAGSEMVEDTFPGEVPHKKIKSVVKDRSAAENHQNSISLGRSLGYAFLTFHSHADALKAQVATSNIDAADVFRDENYRGRKLIVEFAIENRKSLEIQKGRIR